MSVFLTVSVLPYWLVFDNLPAISGPGILVVGLDKIWESDGHLVITIQGVRVTWTRIRFAPLWAAGNTPGSSSLRISLREVRHHKEKKEGGGGEEGAIPPPLQTEKCPWHADDRMNFA